MENTELKQEEKEKKNYWAYLLLFALLLFFCVFGITYSIYTFDDNSDNQVETGNIIFTYSDVNQGGNGIYLQNAVPVSDSLGKIMTGEKEYFDFYITTTTKNSNVDYKILVKKDEKISTLSNDKVRIYLTQMLGSYEQELVLTNFSDLPQEKIENQNYYVLYTKSLIDDLENYSESYRLRMWVKSGATNYEDQYFSVKVDVYAYQVGEE